jgi:acyl-coenzyme A synthetase/AMP-(fatty) acid ligase
MPASATTAETVSLAKIATMTHLFVSPKLLSQGLAVAEALGLPESRVLILQGYVPGFKSLDDFVDLARRKQLEVKTREVQHDTPAYLMFSSGTSGRPKGVSRADLQAIQN